MSNLKFLKVRIQGVKSTQKITRAMKMVAAAKLRRAHIQEDAAFPYIASVVSLVQTMIEKSKETPFNLVNGNGKDELYLLVVITSDRGLCGGFNHSILKAVKKHAKELTNLGKKLKFLCIGKKGYEYVKLYYAGHQIEFVALSNKSGVQYTEISKLSEKLILSFNEYQLDKVTMFYSQAINSMQQKIHIRNLIPLDDITLQSKHKVITETSEQDFELEPSQTEIMSKIVHRAIAVFLYNALLNSNVGEQNARMTAMDNACRNAEEMLKKITLQYNRTRQANITKELIEIISGAEAV